MLNQVLHEIETARGPVTIQDLCQILDVERDALEGMLQFWVRKGRLQNDARFSGDHKGGSCGTSCNGIADCAFIAKMPRTYSISVNEEIRKQPHKIR